MSNATTQHTTSARYNLIGCVVFYWSFNGLRRVLFGLKMCTIIRINSQEGLRVQSFSSVCSMTISIKGLGICNVGVDFALQVQFVDYICGRVTKSVLTRCNRWRADAVIIVCCNDNA